MAVDYLQLMYPAAADLVITSTFCVYLLAMVAIGVIAYRRNLSDYMLGGHLDDSLA